MRHASNVPRSKGSGTHVDCEYEIAECFRDFVESKFCDPEKSRKSSGISHKLSACSGTHISAMSSRGGFWAHQEVHLSKVKHIPTPLQGHALCAPSPWIRRQSALREHAASRRTCVGFLRDVWVAGAAALTLRSSEIHAAPLLVMKP